MFTAFEAGDDALGHADLLSEGFLSELLGTAELADLADHLETGNAELEFFSVHFRLEQIAENFVKGIEF